MIGIEVRQHFWFILYSSLLISSIKIVCAIIEMIFNKTAYLLIFKLFEKIDCEMIAMKNCMSIEMCYLSINVYTYCKFL